MAFSPGTAHSPEIQSYRTWWGAASPILNDTPVVYTTYNRTRIRNAHTYIYICTYILTQSLWTVTKVIRRKHIVQPTGFGACSSTCCQWDGEDLPAPWERSNSHPPVRGWWLSQLRHICITRPQWVNSLYMDLQCLWSIITVTNPAMINKQIRASSYYKDCLFQVWGFPC